VVPVPPPRAPAPDRAAQRLILPRPREHVKAMREAGDGRAATPPMLDTTGRLTRYAGASGTSNRRRQDDLPALEPSRLTLASERAILPRTSRLSRARARA